MGKKAKIGKSRKDKYYHLAKESGFRSRAAFKLLQLNRKFQFLDKAKVCIDLCAAPGGWTQVCQQNMPMSSLILAVDLVPIKPIHNVVGLTEDITTAKCRQTLKREMHEWKADVVLNDGAPNVGKNWIHDAFQQAQLTLMALKLATEFLKKGGWFVTKVFRSKDYHALIWVFKQLFKSVHATKPQASRNESAEIFVVCQNYRAPDKLDPKFLDVKYVFKDVHIDGKPSLNLIHPEKTKKKADGYDDDDTSFHHKLKASEFIAKENFMELMSKANQIVMDTAEIKNHPLTTSEVMSCCNDIKVLGKKEIRSIWNWRKKMQQELDKKGKETQKDGSDASSAEEDSAAEEEKIQQQIKDLEEEQSKDLKRKRKKVMKEKRKLRDKMQLKMVHPGDYIEETDDISLFNLKKIKSKEGLQEVQKEDLIDEESDEESGEESTNRKKYMHAYDRYQEEREEMSDDEEESEEEENEEEESSDEEEEEPEKDGEDQENPLVVDLVTKDVKAQRKTEMWFNKDLFSGLEEEKDEDIEIEKMAEMYKKRGGMVLGQDKPQNELLDQNRPKDDDSEESEADDDLQFSGDEDVINGKDSDDNSSLSSDSGHDSDSDYDINASLQRTLMENTRGDKMAKTRKNKSSKDGFEVVPMNEPPKKVIKLDPVELALAEELIKSSKRRREIEEMSYNRYTHGDENLPDWFAREESRHNRKQLPITKERIDANKERLNAINSRPIKKVAEAKARKKRKMTKKLERARKKAESVSETVEISEGEKWKQIKEIYKRAGLLNKKKKQITYVIAKRGGGKKATRPDGVKGFYKVVDGRMKKDKRANKTSSKQSMKGKGAKGRTKGKKK